MIAIASSIFATTLREGNVKLEENIGRFRFSFLLCEFKLIYDTRVVLLTTFYGERDFVKWIWFKLGVGAFMLRNLSENSYFSDIWKATNLHPVSEWEGKHFNRLDTCREIALVLYCNLRKTNLMAGLNVQKLSSFKLF